MKIYIITQGCYSDYHICAVAIDKDRANRLQKLYSDAYDKAIIEEYDTEDVGFDRVDLDNDPLERYYITLRRNEKPDVKKEYIRASMRSKHITEGGFAYSYFRKEYDPNVYYAHVVAEDEEHAVKIAQDMYAKALAEYWNLC